MRVEKTIAEDGTEYRSFDCPGCGNSKVLPITGPRAWGYNGNDDLPTFKPSILQRIFRDDSTKVCHSFVTDGKIQFLNDCTHSLAGKTVELPEVSE